MAVTTILHCTDGMLLVVECHRTIGILIHFLKSKVPPDARNASADETAQQKYYQQALQINSHVPPWSRESSTNNNFLAMHAFKKDIKLVPVNRRDEPTSHHALLNLVRLSPGEISIVSAIGNSNSSRYPSTSRISNVSDVALSRISRYQPPTPK